MNNQASKLTPNQKFFHDNLDAWLQDDTYNRKFIVISNQQIQAVYNRGGDAYCYAIDNFQPSEYVIEQVIPVAERKIYAPSVFVGKVQ